MEPRTDRPPRLDLIDGTYELFRAHFSKRPPYRDAEGRDVKATVGVASSILALLQDAKDPATHVAVAFDNPIRSFRNDLLASYKTEEGVPPELLAQFDLVELAVKALGVVVWSMKEFEADDALAAGALRYGDEVDQVRIHTVDKDLGACIRGQKVVQVDRRNERLIDEALFRELRGGIAPESIPDWLALVGDTADGIPGITGFGEKGAAAVLARYPHLEDIPRDPRQWEVNVRGKDKLAAELFARWDEALLYRTVATLRTDVPLKETLADLEWKGVHEAAWNTLCDGLGVTTLRNAPKRFR